MDGAARGRNLGDVEQTREVVLALRRASYCRAPDNDDDYPHPKVRPPSKRRREFNLGVGAHRVFFCFTVSVSCIGGMIGVGLHGARHR